jgi:hypothetical protein
MKSMRRAGIIAIVLILILMIFFAGCGQRVPTRNTTAKNPWGNVTPKKTTGSSQTTIVPVTTSPIVEATLIPEETETPITAGTYRTEPPPVNLTANLTLLDEKTLVFSYNRTAYTYNLETPPLLIEVTLTVPNITKTRVITDPVSGGDKIVPITYPNPSAFFEVTVRDIETNRIIARNGYGGMYDVSYGKKVWIRYPGEYYIEFTGNLVTANVKFRAPNPEA